MFSIKAIGKIFKLILILLLIFILFLVASRLPRIFYPTPYQEAVNQYAQEYGMDPLFVYAVIKAESGFDENAQSHRGALGLMQLTEDTAYWIGGEIGLSLEGREDILKPENNIRMGTWFLAFLMRQYGGDLTNVLSAYNAGSGNVERWLEDSEHSSDGVTLENIPFEETEQYVEKVNRYYQQYQKIYAGI